MSHGRMCYGQLGEDMIMSGLANSLISGPIVYIDIGAHAPQNLSNTYHFYERGFSGVLIEPDPFLCDEIRRVRPRDTVINAGVSWTDAKIAKLYVLTARTLNTFSKESALKACAPESVPYYGVQKIESEVDVPLVNINEVISGMPIPPNILSIDTEGCDYDILKTLDFSKYAPKIACVETHGGSDDASEVTALMKSKGYYIAAFTGLNTIYRR